MKLKLTIERSDRSTADVVVTADATATVGEVARKIAVSDPRQPASPAQLFTLSVRRPGSVEPEFLMPGRVLNDCRVGSGLTVLVTELDSKRDWSRQKLSDVTAELRVLNGPDAGARFVLDSDVSRIGRGSGCEVRLNDPMVSKEHAQITLERDRVVVIDNNSANGVVVDGALVPRIELYAGARFEVGDTQLELVSLVQTRQSTAPPIPGGEPVLFNRAPRLEVRFEGEKVKAPKVPNDEDPQGFPFLMMIMPLLMGAVLFAVTRSVLSVVFVALSPLLMIGNFLTTRSQRKSKRKRAIKRFIAELAKKREQLLEWRETERATRLAEAPSLAENVASVERRNVSFWTRRPEHWSYLVLRLGLGTAPSRTTIDVAEPAELTIAEYQEQAEALAEEFKTVDGVPILESIELAGGLGVAGAASAFAYVRGLLMQIAALHSPADVAVGALLDPRLVAEFDWLKWLPHASGSQHPLADAALADNAATGQQLLSALEGLVEQRDQGPEGPGSSSSRPPLPADGGIDDRAQHATVDDDDLGRPLPTLVLLVAGDLPVDLARFLQVMERAVDAGVHPIWLAANQAGIPAMCRTFIEVPDAGVSAAASFVREGRKAEPLEVEGLAVAQALTIAREMSRVVDVAVYEPDQSDLPPSVSFLSLLGPELAKESSAVIDRWHQNESIIDRSAPPVRRKKGAGLRALVGQAGSAALHLDLRAQGPHALVGGTTGAGKSEFLQAWVLGMAAEHSPDRLTFLFVDYKGGSAFADCIHLPHTVGLVTDLNTHLVRRALTSLRAEIHYREHLFNRKKAKDLVELERRGDPECPPALVLVIDEFAALAGEIPEFVDGVVDVAQRGRSLGIHLIMATQRPAGVIKDNLRANTNLRVALRMADESDSTDVIGTPVAATFDPSLPGRGMVKTGPGRLTVFQTGYAGGWTTDEVAPSNVEVSDLAFGQGQPWQAPADEQATDQADPGPNDTARLVEVMQAAAQSAEIPTPRKPWLEELAPMYDLAKLRQRTDTELLLGVVDDPHSQSQYPSYFKPDIDGNLVYFGGGGAGKTTALRSLAIAAAITPRGGPVQVYGLDFASGGLRSLEDLPHVGAIIPGDDDERIARLLRYLRELIDERVEAFARVRASTITEYRQLAKSPDVPRILVLIDGMATFRQEYEFQSSGSVFTAFQQMLADGRPVGVHFALTADRPGSISPAVSANLQLRVVLRLADENDYLLLDTEADVLSQQSPPGRGVFNGLELQIPVFGGSRNLAEQSRAMNELTESMLRNGVVPAPTIERLADDVPLSVLPVRPGEVVIGLDDVTLSPVSIAPEGTFLLAGPPQSGRSTALLTLVGALSLALPNATRYYFGPARSSVGRLPGWSKTATDAESAAALATEAMKVTESPAQPGAPAVFVIESIADFLGGSADGPMADLIKQAKRNGHFVIAEAETSAWSQSWPLIVEVRNGRRGFALQPDQLEGDTLFRTSFPRTKRADFPPGRGFLVQAGRVVKVQLAHPD